MILLWTAVVTSEKQRKEEKNGIEVSVSRFPIQSDRFFSYTGEPWKLGTVMIVLYFYSYFSLWDISS